MAPSSRLPSRNAGSFRPGAAPPKRHHLQRDHRGRHRLRHARKGGAASLRQHLQLGRQGVGPLLRVVQAQDGQQGCLTLGWGGRCAWLGIASCAMCIITAMSGAEWL